MAQPAQAHQGYHLSPEELRYPHEIPAMIASFAVAGVLLVLTGLVLKVLIPVVITLVVVGVTLYFTAISKVLNAIRVGPDQFPQVHSGAQQAAQRLCMDPPRVFIRQSPQFTASAQDLGRKEGLVTLSTALVENFTNAEIQFLVARQFGHIKCRHTTWALLHNNSADGLLGAVGAALRAGLQVVFTFWSRTVELTADRAGLIGGQDIRAAISAIVKEMVGPQVYARINLPALLEQMQELEANSAARIAQAAGLEGKPYAFNRIRELLRFYRSPLYQNVAARQGKAGTTMLQYGQGVGTGDLFAALAHQAQAQSQVPAAPAGPAAAPVAPAAPACRSCGKPIRAGARFCGVCGAQQA